ncbi:hypothetical protein [Pseudomonas sp. PDM27]|uniref:hypothetical protein n=1 Tax=Pseudomonas sp. PDM27 TaxID=2854769 RepID=UPI00210A3BDF|nr:hypothetical protein [Pseudomonas sp. PDM27]
MKRALLRLTPQVAGELQQQLTKAVTGLREVTRFRKEFDRQLTTLIGQDALRKTAQGYPQRIAAYRPDQGGHMSQNATEARLTLNQRLMDHLFIENRRKAA